LLKTTGNTAVLIGATGLVGHALLRLLLADKRFSKVVVLGRRSLMVEDSKLTEYVINFDQPEKWVNLVQGDVAFSTLGTTLRSAGSKEAQYKVDFTYQLRFAEAAKQNGIQVFVLVSAAGANAKSSNFYIRMKGELDQAVTALGFQQTYIIRPGFLKGLRREFRLGEVLAQPLLEVLRFVPCLRKFRPIDCWIVAKAMINSAFSAKAAPVETYTLEEVFTVGTS
jgi:uncharacterized protein YbjT (DUF2867 family)